MIYTVRGLNRTLFRLINLEKKLVKEIDKTNGQFMRDVKKSAKLLAPRNTGELANSIILTKIKDGYILEVKSPYGAKQEEGKGLPYRDDTFKPRRDVKHKPGSIIKGGNVTSGKGVVVRRYTPFVKPALERHIGKLAQQLDSATKKAIKK